MPDDQKFPSDLADRFQVRMPNGLRDRLRDAAEANKRSMNAEIIARLEESFAAPAPASVDTKRLQTLIDTLLEAVEMHQDGTPPPYSFRRKKKQN